MWRLEMFRLFVLCGLEAILISGVWRLEMRVASGE